MWLHNIHQRPDFPPFLGFFQCGGPSSWLPQTEEEDIHHQTCGLQGLPLHHRHFRMRLQVPEQSPAQQPQMQPWQRHLRVRHLPVPPGPLRAPLRVRRGWLQPHRAGQLQWTRGFRRTSVCHLQWSWRLRVWPVCVPQQWLWQSVGKAVRVRWLQLPALQGGTVLR